MSHNQHLGWTEIPQLLTQDENSKLYRGGQKLIVMDRNGGRAPRELTPRLVDQGWRYEGKHQHF